MESEVRYYYSKKSKNKLIDYLKSFNSLNYKGRFYEKTSQYNHPMKKYDFYSKSIDGRFRIRETKSDDYYKCMITWKRRLKNNNSLIHNEEEVEISVDNHDNLIFLLDNVLHLKLVEEYERYRNLFYNDDVEIVVDEYPFGLALEIENKSKDKDPEKVITEWLNNLKLDINDSYKLSWDDKYEELCTIQNKKKESIVSFDKDMPEVKENF